MEYEDDAWYGSLIDIFWTKINPCKLKTRCNKMGGKLIERKIRTKVMFHFFFSTRCSKKFFVCLKNFVNSAKKQKSASYQVIRSIKIILKLGHARLTRIICEQKFAFFTSSFKPKPIIIDAKNFKNAQKTKCMMWAMTNLQIGVIIDPSQPKKFVNVPIRMANLEIY